MKRLALIGVFVVLITACGGGSGPLGLFGPPSAQDIAGKPAGSSMKDGHFKVTGTLVNGATRTAGTGEGVMVVKPKRALQLNVQVDTGTFLGRVGFDLIQIDGKQYSRIGSQDWTSSDNAATASTSSHPVPKYVGEEDVGGQKTWHITWKEATTTYDEWVRGSDGYLVKYRSTADGGTTFEMAFNKFNTGGSVKAPPPPDPKAVAGKAYLAMVGPINGRVSSTGSSLDADRSLGNLDAYKRDLLTLSGVESDFLSGLGAITFPPDLQADVSAVISDEQGLISLYTSLSSATSWSVIAAADPQQKALLNKQTTDITKLRSDLGLPPPT